MKKTPAARSRADSPALESIRVDPGSAMTEELKARHPELPVPVFSTMALEHGKNAAGASAVKEGFSWNPQMDLLWALGYPEVVLIADGLPEGDSRASLIEHWNGQGRGFWLGRSAIANEQVLPRRAAHAILWELELGDDPFDQPEADFASQTLSRSVDPKATAALLRKVGSHRQLPRAVLVFEALVGPSVVLEEICAIAEDTEFDARDPAYRGRVVLAARPLLRRVPLPEAEQVMARFQRATRGPAGFDACVELVVDPFSYAKKELEKGSPNYALGALQWVDGEERLLELAHDARTEFPDVPSPRHMFAGGEGLIEREVACAGKYDSRDVGEAYLLHYTTIRSPKLLPVQLEYLSKGDSRAAMQHWLLAHAEELRPWVQALSNEPGHEKNAADALEVLA